MLLNLGADVADPDGGKLGELSRIIVNPDTREVISIVAEEAGLSDREMIIPMDVILDTDDVMIRVDVIPEEFGELDPLEYEHNVAPPPDAAEADSDIVKDPDIPDVPAVGAATGVESIAFTPIIEEHFHVPTGDIPLNQSTHIWATDGEVGRLKAVVTDDALHLTSVIVHEGWLFTTDVEVPAELVHSIQPDTIVLSVAKSEIPEPQNA